MFLVGGSGYLDQLVRQDFRYLGARESAGEAQQGEVRVGVGGKAEDGEVSERLDEDQSVLVLKNDLQEAAWPPPLRSRLRLAG